MYMCKVLASAYGVKKIAFDPLQVVAEPNFNIPQDTESEAKTVQTLIGAGLPKRYAFSKLSDVDDVEYILQLLEQEKEDEQDITSFYDGMSGDDDTDNPDNVDKATNADLDKAQSGGEKINLLNGAQIQALTGIVQTYNRGDLSRNAAITLAVSSLGISRENAEAIIEEKI